MAADLANPMKEQADHAMGTPWMWPRRSSGGDRSRSEEYANGSWEEQAFAEDAGGHMGDGSIWPPRSYSCTFCRREFRSAQALGGHMNVHRRDRALLRQSAPGGVSNPPEPASDLNAPANSAVVPILNGSEHHLLCSRYADYCSHNSFVYCSSPSTIVSVNRSSPYPAPVMYSYPKSNASGVLPDDPDRRAMSAIPLAHPPSPAVAPISPYRVPPVHFMPPFYSSTGASDPSPLTVNAFEVSKESSDSTGGVISEVEGSSIVTDSLFKDDHEGTLKKLTIGTALRPMTYDLRHDENASDVRRIRPDAMEDSVDDLDLELRLGGRPLQVHHK